MSRKKKNVIETHGKVEAEKFEPTLLEQVWGVDNLSRYGTLNEQEYQTRLEGMTRADLEAHARQVGVIIVEYSPRLRDKLIAEFRNYVALVQKPVTAVHPATRISDAAMKVLAEGR